MNKERFINQSELNYGVNRLDYSLVPDELNYEDNVSLICIEHGVIFQVNVNKHLYRNKFGCPICNREICGTKFSKIHWTKDLLQKRLDISLGKDKLDLSLLPNGPLKTKEKYLFKCNSCGKVFEGTIENLISGRKKYCTSCKVYLGIEKIIKPTKPKPILSLPYKIHKRIIKDKLIKLPKLNLIKNKEDFLKRVTKIFLTDLDFSKFNYVNSRTKSIVVCNKCGHEFLAAPADLYNGVGCPCCHMSKYARKVRNLLVELHINFTIEQQFPWLVNKIPMRLDFYLPDFNIAIECQGGYHFTVDGFYNKTDEDLYKVLEKDKLKARLCDENGVGLIYYCTNKNYKDFSNGHLVINSLSDLKDFFENSNNWTF